MCPATESGKDGRRINKLEVGTIKKCEQQREKKLKDSEQSIRDLWDYDKRFNIPVM